MNDAKRQAEDAEAAVYAESKKRLEELLGLDLNRRINHLDDPDLVLIHRIELRRSLQAKSRSISRFTAFNPLHRFNRLRAILLRNLRHLPRTRAAHILLGMTLAVGLFCFAESHHDGQRGVLITPFTYFNTDENGDKVLLVAPARTLVVAVKINNDTFLARTWIPTVGYMTVEVPSKAIALFERPTILQLITNISRFKSPSL